jgi:hypothetical protein
MTEADAAHDMEAAFEPSRTANRAEAMMDRLAVLRQAGRLPGETRWIWPDRDPEPVGNGKSGMAPVLAARPRHVQGEPGRGGAAVILRHLAGPETRYRSGTRRVRPGVWMERRSSPVWNCEPGE